MLPPFHESNEIAFYLAMYIGSKLLGNAQLISEGSKSTKYVEQLWVLLDKPKLAYTSGKAEDWASFRNQNKRVKKLILEAKEEYTKDLLEQNEGNPRRFWRCINEISGLGKNKRGKGMPND